MASSLFLSKLLWIDLHVFFQLIWLIWIGLIAEKVSNFIFFFHLFSVHLFFKELISLILHPWKNFPKLLVHFCLIVLLIEEENQKMLNTLKPRIDRIGVQLPTAEIRFSNLSMDAKDIIATGGLDTNAVIFYRTSGQILSTLSGHSKKVNNVKFVARDELFVTGSADKTVRIWQGNEEGNYNCLHILKDHTKEVQAVTVHATNNYFVTASLDNTWCFYDLASERCLTQVEVGDSSSDTEGYTSAAFHPDGLILGTRTSDSVVKVWDVKSQTNVAKFESHAGPVTAMSFSENGYFLATAAGDGVKLWDLRKLRNFRTLSPYQDTPTYSVEFDHSVNYLAMSGSDVRVYNVANVKSEWNEIKALPDLSGTGKTTCVKFGPDAKYLAVGSMDRNLRVFGLPGDENTNEENEGCNCDTKKEPGLKM